MTPAHTLLSTDVMTEAASNLHSILSASLVSVLYYLVVFAGHIKRLLQGNLLVRPDRTDLFFFGEG